MSGDIRTKIDMALDVSFRAKGAVMLTADGNIINPLYPTPVTIHEVAHVLSNFCRYGGHCPTFYSVGQHSILCSYLVPQRDGLPLQALLHDAHEAYFGDWPKPVKNAVPALAEAEQRMEVYVRRELGIPEVLAPEVKQADLDALEMEMKWLWLGQSPRGVERLAALSLAMQLDSPAKTRIDFLRRYEELTGHTEAPPAGEQA